MLGCAHGGSFFSIRQHCLPAFSLCLPCLLANSCMYMLCVFCVSAKFHQSRDDPACAPRDGGGKPFTEMVVKSHSQTGFALYAALLDLIRDVNVVRSDWSAHLPLAYKAEEWLAEATETIRYVGRGTWKRCGQWWSKVSSLGCVRQARVSTKYCGPSMRRNSEGEDILGPTTIHDKGGAGSRRRHIWTWQGMCLAQRTCPV